MPSRLGQCTSHDQCSESKFYSLNDCDFVPPIDSRYSSIMSFDKRHFRSCCCESFPASWCPVLYPSINQTAREYTLDVVRFLYSTRDVEFESFIENVQRFRTNESCKVLLYCNIYHTLKVWPWHNRFGQSSDSKWNNSVFGHNYLFWSVFSLLNRESNWVLRTVSTLVILRLHTAYSCKYHVNAMFSGRFFEQYISRLILKRVVFFFLFIPHTLESSYFNLPL